MLFRSSDTAIVKAVTRRDRGGKQALLDRLFTLWFARFIYNQTWEDPIVDLEALKLTTSSSLVMIASGGCNVLNYLIAEPARIVAIDLNPAHMALTRLKIAAMASLPNYESFFRFFGIAQDDANVDAYFSAIAPTLDPESRHFWEQRSLFGRQRIGVFARGLYKNAVLGRFIGFLHRIGRLYGQNLGRLLEIRDSEQRRRIWDRCFGPIFSRGLVRFLSRQQILFYGLGIPPHQFASLRADCDGNLGRLYCERLRHLACDFDLSENYFAWQAFGRQYDVRERRATPPYLKAEGFDSIRKRLGRIETHCMSMTDYLATQSAGSHDRYVLLDSVDWMDEENLASLWSEIRRTARPGARVIFRTAAAQSAFEIRLPRHLLQGWYYEAEQSRALLERDRSAIYGGFHLYVH
jgi:S-adenosylmethionine-diacylglycerol 3-amino-3-carboxypropyl transferase